MRDLIVEEAKLKRFIDSGIRPMLDAPLLSSS